MTQEDAARIVQELSAAYEHLRVIPEIPGITDEDMLPFVSLLDAFVRFAQRMDARMHDAELAWVRAPQSEQNGNPTIIAVKTQASDFLRVPGSEKVQ